MCISKHIVHEEKSAKCENLKKFIILGILSTDA